MSTSRADGEVRTPTGQWRQYPERSVSVDQLSGQKAPTLVVMVHIACPATSTRQIELFLEAYECAHLRGTVPLVRICIHGHAGGVGRSSTDSSRSMA
jgi:hypothetical protein